MPPITTTIRNRLLATADLKGLARKEARARYMRTIYRKSNKTINISLPHETYTNIIAPLARQTGLTPTEYLREAALAYAGKRFLVPAGLEEALFAVTDQLAALGNNLNQIARHVNLEQAASREDLSDARKLLSRAEQLVEQAVRSPSPAP